MSLTIKSADENASPKKSLPEIDESRIVHRDPAELVPWDGNPRVHNERQIEALMVSIREFGFRTCGLLKIRIIRLARLSQQQPAQLSSLRGMQKIIRWQANAQQGFHSGVRSMIGFWLTQLNQSSATYLHIYG